MKFAARINSFRKSPTIANKNDGNFLNTKESLDMIATIKGITHVELNYPEHFADITVDELRHFLKECNLKNSGIALRYDTTTFVNGEFTNPDSDVRKKAIQLTKEAVQICQELGGEVTTIWQANDGFDYPFQLDYNKAMDMQVSALREIASEFPNNKISFEYKPYQPRAFSFIGDIATTLMAIEETGCANLGVTLDFCHMLMKKENPAYSLALAARKNRLIGFHLNDGYKDNDDGLMIGSVHLLQTLEFIYYSKKYHFDGINYFDTFPQREHPVREVSKNIETYLALDKFIQEKGMDFIENLIQKQDAVQVQEMLLDLIRH